MNDKIIGFVDRASIVSFYLGRIVGNFRRGYKGCYTPIFENQEWQRNMRQYEQNLAMQNQPKQEVENKLKVVGFS